MERPPIPDGREFRRRLTWVVGAPGTLSAVLIAAYIAAVVDLGRDGWTQMGWVVLVTSLGSTALSQVLQRRLDGPVVRALDKLAAGTCTREDSLAGYSAARRLPDLCIRTQSLTYSIAGIVTPLWMKVAIPDTTPFTMIVVCAAPLVGGAATLCFSIWSVQRFAAPTRDFLASQLSY